MSRYWSPVFCLVLYFAGIGFPVPGAAQSVRYEFTGGSMAPTTSNLPAGVVASDFSLGAFSLASLTDNGGSGHSLRLSRGDLVTTSSTALEGQYLSFSLTIPAGLTVNLISLGLDFTSGGVTGAEFMNSRVFSNVHGHDLIVEKTIGTLGRISNGADTGTQTISLANPDTNPTNGSVVNNGEFDNLTNRTITFLLPFIRDGQTTATDFIDIDNITLVFSTVTMPNVPAPLVVMPLGDSITEGTGAAGGYRAPLYQALATAGLPIRLVGSRANGTTPELVSAGQIQHEGHGSYATTLLTGNLDAELVPVALPYGTPPNTNNGGHWLTGTISRPALYPDVILLMIGTNDMGMFQRTAAQTLGYYELLLDKLVALRPEATIICSSVPPYSGSAFVGTNPVKDYSQREANNAAFNQLLPGLVATYQANGHRVRFSDVRLKLPLSAAATMIGTDGVHPTATGYNAISDAWFEAIQQLPLLASWKILHFGSTGASAAADLADPDGDGTPNLLEFALGTHPEQGDTPAIRATLTPVAGDHYLSVVFSRRKHANVRVAVEVSSNLYPGSWTTDTVEVGSPASLGPESEQVIIRDQQPYPASGKRFIRLRVSNP